MERAQSDAALKRSEAFLAEAQRLSSTGSFSWRVETDEITWSEQLYRIFEFDRGGARDARADLLLESTRKTSRLYVK